MFSKEKKILNSEELDLYYYLENTDLYNSKIYSMIPRLPYIGEYQVDLNEYRIDLISKDIYDIDAMAEVLLIYNGITISELVRGLVIKVPSLTDVRNLFRNISGINNPVEYLKTAAEE